MAPLGPARGARAAAVWSPRLQFSEWASEPRSGQQGRWASGRDVPKQQSEAEEARGPILQMDGL